VRRTADPITGTKVCSRCERSLALSSFSRKLSNADGYQYRCKDCVRETAQETILQRMYKGTLNRARKRGVEFALTKDDLMELDQEQNGQCAITGLPLNWEPLKRERTAQRICPADRVSIDRINPKQGYVKGNVQLVTDLANRIKGNNSMDEVLAFCHAVVSHHKTSQ